MSKYYLKSISSTLAYIQQSAQKIGHVSASKERPGQFLAVVGEHRIYAASRNEAFTEMVRKLNRINLCGEDDEAKAREALRVRTEANNATVQAEAKALNDIFRPILGQDIVSVRRRSRRVVL